MGLDYYEFINNARVGNNKVVPPQKKENTAIELPDNEIYIALSDRAAETANLLEVYNLSYYRRKGKARLSIPHAEAEIDKLIFNNEKTI